MKVVRIMVPIVLSIVATVLALAASKMFERIEIDREFAPLTGKIDPVPSI